MRLSVISLQVTNDHEDTRVKEREMSILTGRVAYWYPVKTVVCKKAELEANMALRLCWYLK